MTESPPGARPLALDVLRRSGARLELAPRALDAALDRHEMAAVDRRLATELVYGVVRRRRTLDAIIEQFVRRPLRQVEADLREILRMGVYQLLLLEAIPPHAALAETVELARHVGKPRATGFINGVLRAVAAAVTDRFTSEPAANAVPFDAGRYRTLERTVLPDPAASPLQYIAGGFSLPDWLVRRWLERWGFEEVCRLGFWFNAAPPLYVRVNPLRITRDDLIRRWRDAGIAAEAADHPQAIRLPGRGRVVDLPGFDEGWFTVQDLSAMGAASELAPAPGDTVLDLCAAPGGKTTHLAELMQNRGRIVACDVDAERLNRVVEQCRRLGVEIVEPVLLDAASGFEPPAGPFDAVLVDVPCSNTGVLGRRPEARWRIKPGDVARLAMQARELLRRGAMRLTRGGRLAYSTCSIEPEENEAVVSAVLAEKSELQLLRDEQLVPGQPADGGYRALLERAR